MKLGIIVLLLMSIPSLAQEKPQQPSSTGNAKTTGPCSPAIPGNHNTVIYNNEDCLSPEEVEENQILNSRAYEGLGDALNTEDSIRKEWATVISSCQMLLIHHVTLMPANPQFAVETRVLQERYHFCILEAEKTFDPKWKPDEDLIKKAVDAAAARVEANEEKKLQTINQRKAWKNEFDRTWGTDYANAMRKADHDPTLEELINDDSNTGRFALLEKYLEDLRTKLGDYPSQ